jgi:3-oxoacyl-[acyl-carrier protein] reductase
MGRLDGGVIVNISSILAHRALVGSAVYGATKAALEALTRQFAMELGGHGVRVAAVAPGLIATAMTDLISEELQQKLRGQIASGELGKPEHIAEAVWHLIENEYTTGAVLAVDGGLGL